MGEEGSGGKESERDITIKARRKWCVDKKESSERSVDETVMPAEIDTGGPRVLHCDYRADCPIPIVASASAESSLRRKNRVVRASIVRRLPRAGASVSLDDSASKPRRWSGFPSRRIGLRGFRRTELPAVHDVPGDADASRTLQYRDSDRDVSCPRQLESRLHDTIGEEREGDATQIARTGSGRWCSSERDEVDWRFQRVTDPWGTRENHPAHGCHGERDRLTEGGFSDGNWTVFRRASNARIGRSAAWLSSQSRDPSIEEEQSYEKLASSRTAAPSLADETWKEVDGTNSWRCESRVAAKVGPADPQAEFPRYNESLRSSRRTRKKKKRRECPNSRSSYFQLAFLLLLVALGQCGLRKSSVHRCCAKPAIGGFSVVAIGTVISAVSAGPVDLMSDAGVRAERSANLSHITGASRKIQMYIKNRHLQILPDGTVNGSNDDTSDYSEYTFENPFFFFLVCSSIEQRESLIDTFDWNWNDRSSSSWCTVHPHALDDV